MTYSIKKISYNVKARLVPFLIIIALLISSLCGCKKSISLGSVPDYEDSPYVQINGGTPFFKEKEITTESFEKYSELDMLGRCGVAFACIGLEIMPTEERGDIANITPSGWELNGLSNNNSYDFVDGGYIYNRCHLIGYQLAGENDNELNLVTGTRYMNIDGMLPFENMVDDYVEETSNHVMYRVTPIYSGMNLLCGGVLMEAYSVEDGGEGISFCIFVYNVQPGVIIDYRTGANVASGEPIPSPGTNISPDSGAENNTGETTDRAVYDYVLNTSSKKFHLPNTSCGDRISDKNREIYTATRDEIIAKGYSPCGICNP